LGGRKSGEECRRENGVWAAHPVENLHLQDISPGALREENAGVSVQGMGRKRRGPRPSIGMRAVWLD
jgi:hypothetical protein